MLSWYLFLPMVRSCAPILTSAPVNIMPITPLTTTTTTTTTPPAPMNADYYDDINLQLTKIDASKSAVSPLSPSTVVKGNTVLLKPPQPKPLSIPLLRDMYPIPLEKPAKTFPSFFDFFRPLPLPTLSPIKNIFSYKLSDTPFGHVPRLPSPVSRKTVFTFKISPPISWTYCEPLCGSGDQAVDAESAWDNAQVDVKEGLAHAFSTLHLPPLRDEQVMVSYNATSTILEEFGGKYDYKGFQYVTIGNAVAFRRHKENPSKNGSFFVEVKVEIQHNNINNAVLRQIADKLSVFLQLNKRAKLTEQIHVFPE